MVGNLNIIRDISNVADDDKSEDTGPRVRPDAKHQADAGSGTLSVQLSFR